MTLRSIKVTTSKAKSDYDIIVERGVDDLEWIGPAGAASIEIRYKGATNGLAPAVSFADAHPSGDPNRKIFFATRHCDVFVKKSRAGGGVEIEYEIVINPARGPSTIIDPFVKILP